MLFGKKNTKDCELATSSELIEKNATQINYLISLVDGRPELIGKLKEAQVKIKYFGPTTVQPAAKLDKKIENIIGDIKIALSKAKTSGVYLYGEELVDGLMLLVAERKSITA